jgi:5-formyltetrahydrofolate cyclo-ligase
VGVFAPLIDEPDIELLRAPGKAVCYPIIQDEALQFIAVSDPSTLVRGTRGVRQPPFDPARVISLDRLELILVPGAAFTPRGERLGRGGGFYDRLLASPERRARSLGICFDCQLLPELPVEPHDQPVDGVVTESGIQFR